MAKGTDVGESPDFDSADVDAPDGGYGWIVVAAAFVVNMIADGVTFSFGIVLSELFEVLPDSRDRISLICSFLNGVPLLLGPVTSLLIDRFGCRPVTIAGGLVSGVGFAAGIMLPRVTSLFIVSAGIVSGIGLGLCYLPAVVAVSFYFVKNRSLATGISVSGSGVGTVVFAHVTRECIDAFAWRGAFLLLGGALLHMCICGSLLLPLLPSPPRHRQPDQQVSRSMMTIPTYLTDYLPRRISGTTPQESQLILDMRASLLKQADAKMSDAGSCGSADKVRCLSKSSTAHALTTTPQEVNRTSVESHRSRRRLLSLNRRVFGSRRRPQLWVSCPEFCRSCRSSSIWCRFRQNFVNVKILKDVKFLFSSLGFLGFLASNCILYFWYDITYTFLPDHAKDLGVSEWEVSLIISLIGVSNTVGQIVIGYIGDSPRIDTLLLYVTCIFMTGIANCLVPWCTSLYSLLVYGICYGFLISANYSLCSIVIIELFGLERFTTGYGFIMFFQGLANLMGPPLMGRMRDLDSNYKRAFVYSGIFVAASNLLILPAHRDANCTAALHRSDANCNADATDCSRNPETPA